MRNFFLYSERTKTCSRADSTRYRSQLTIMNYSLCAVYSIFYIFFYTNITNTSSHCLQSLCLWCCFIFFPLLFFFFLVRISLISPQLRFSVHLSMFAVNIYRTHIVLSRSNASYMWFCLACWLISATYDIICVRCACGGSTNALNNESQWGEQNKKRHETGDFKHMHTTPSSTRLSTFETQCTVYALDIPHLLMSFAMECLAAVSCKRKNDWIHDRFIYTQAIVCLVTSHIFR